MPKTFQIKVINIFAHHNVHVMLPIKLNLNNHLIILSIKMEQQKFKIVQTLIKISINSMMNILLLWRLWKILLIVQEYAQKEYFTCLPISIMGSQMMLVDLN
mmetsp:Transcript_119232/g.178116  ORF Transcript_119232/g.178116 Transcript_119232/m.178116 type:complete len:102 (+) Transcript_119232:465-770(+)